jgi:hypothetical protein
MLCGSPLHTLQVSPKMKVVPNLVKHGTFIKAYYIDLFVFCLLCYIWIKHESDSQSYHTEKTTH